MSEYLWLPTLTNNQGGSVRLGCSPTVLLRSRLARLHVEDRMWITPSSAFHKCSAPSASSRLATCGLHAQSCSFHTELISSPLCPETINLIWSVLHTIMRVHLHVKQHPIHLLRISTWSQTYRCYGMAAWVLFRLGPKALFTSKTTLCLGIIPT